MHLLRHHPRTCHVSGDIESIGALDIISRTHLTNLPSHHLETLIHAPRRTAAAQATTSDDVPEGWELVTETKRNGTVVECNANVLGQKFYKKEDLIRYINYSRESGLSIYAHDFQESKSAICINNKKNHASRNNQQCDKMNSKSKVQFHEFLGVCQQCLSSCIYSFHIHFIHYRI